MAYDIYLPECLVALMEELPHRTRATLSLMFARIAELSTVWPPGDARWQQLAYCDERGLRFYTGGCCVRLSLETDTHRLVVREIGRILAHLPSESLSADFSDLSAPAQ